MKKRLQTIHTNNKKPSERIMSVLFILALTLIANMSFAQTAYISNLSDNTVTVINVATNTVTDTIKVGSNPYGVSVSLDGSKVYIANRGDSTVSAINTATNTVSATIAVGAGAYDLAVSPDGTKVYVSNAAANKVSVINTGTNTVSATVPVGSAPEGIAVSPDGSKVYVANANAHTVYVINTATNAVSDTITLASFPYGISVSPDGSRIYVTTDGINAVSVVDAVADTVLDTIPVGYLPWAISISPDGSKVYAANLDSNSVSVINTATHTVSATVRVYGPEGISVSPDGSKVYVTDADDNTVEVINAATNIVSASIPVGVLPIAFGNFISTYSATAPPVANFQTSDSTICANACINFTDLSTNATSWKWHFAGALDSTSTSQNPQQVCYAAAGAYNVTLIASNGGGHDTITFTNYIHVIPAPPAPAITQVNDTLLNCSTDTSYTSYQWSLDTTLILGATDTTLIITHGGNYNVQVTNRNGCKTATGINVILGIQNYGKNNAFSLSPNPVENKFTVYGLQFITARIEIYNVLGQVCLQSEITPARTTVQSGGNAKSEIDVSSFPAGIYFLQLKSETGIAVQRFVKE